VAGRGTPCNRREYRNAHRASATQPEAIRLLVALTTLLLLRLPLLLEGLAGLLSGWLLRRSVRHGALLSFEAMRGSFGDGDQGREKLVQTYGGDADSRIVNSIWNDQYARMEERPAGVDDVGHIAVLIVVNGAEEWLT
jgi:hypothetical protein